MAECQLKRRGAAKHAMYAAPRATRQQIDLHTNLGMAVLLIALAISTSVNGARQVPVEDFDAVQAESSAALM